MASLCRAALGQASAKGLSGLQTSSKPLISKSPLVARPPCIRISERCPVLENSVWSRRRAEVCVRAASDEESPRPAGLVGEDAAAFDVSQQSTKSWALFTGLLTGVLGLIYLVWIQPGAGLADDFLGLVEGFSNNNPEATILLILFVFAVVHSGLAGLRPKGEQLIGARAYRVIFALVSLPLAIVAIVYFINHRYDGMPLWDLRGVTGVHELVWLLNFVSFYFLYPSTFNILEVAAVDEPKLHMWETGIMRITRHPQMVGQLIWCAAHTLWIGNSFVLVTSAGLMAHHLFGCWHGDRRLSAKYGEAFEIVKARTSTFPLQAIWEGRQVLPADYYKEFLRAPYFAVTAFTLGAYFAHPIMQSASFYLRW
uniref:Carotene synthesis related protein n=1 Tax=Dunaliella salina TaxID=3046 RepID=A0A6H0XI99_DUNSA|nr:carotene synthesis related protein [Dunaliella salina]